MPFNTPKSHIWERIALNDFKITLNRTRSKLPPPPPICSTACFFQVQIVSPICSTRRNVHGIRNFSFSLGHTVKFHFFFLKEVHRMTWKWSWILVGQRYPHMWYYHESSNRFCSIASHFWVAGHFEKVYRMTPKWYLALEGQKVPNICSTSTPGSQISLCFAVQSILNLFLILNFKIPI